MHHGLSLQHSVYFQNMIQVIVLSWLHSALVIPLSLSVVYEEPSSVPARISLWVFFLLGSSCFYTSIQI